MVIRAGCVNTKKGARRAPVGLPHLNIIIKKHTSSSDAHLKFLRKRSAHTGQGIKQYENYMKMVNHCHDHYKKEPNLDNITDQLCKRLQDNKDRKEIAHMPTCSFEQIEAVRLYCAAFPPLNKDQDSPLQYFLPPPAWCGKSKSHNKLKMQSELPLMKNWMSKNKKTASGKERHNSFHSQKKKSKKHCKSFSRSIECKENLPEWMTHEGVWDMNGQDTVKEFIRAIALDEGYGTCENTLTEEVKMMNLKFKMAENVVPDLDDSLDFDTDWALTEDLSQKVRSPVEEEMYAKFEAKFNQRIEALWTEYHKNPDDKQLTIPPLDFHDILHPPSDYPFADPSTKKCSFVSVAKGSWCNHAATIKPAAEPADSPSNIIDGLQNCFKPLNLTDTEVAPCQLENLSCIEGGDLLLVLTTAAPKKSSLALLNHSREHSAFAEVPRRPPRSAPLSPLPELASTPAHARAPAESSPEPEDLLTDPRTHFRPIHCAIEPEPRRYADGATFNISGELDDVEYLRSTSGGMYLLSPRERYLEYRFGRGIDYGRLNLTAAQRCPEMEEPGLRLRFPVRQCDVAVQTSPPVEWPIPCTPPAPAAQAIPVAPLAPPFAPPASWSACEECGRSAKKMRPSDIEDIWSEYRECSICDAPVQRSAAAPAPEELSRDWEELVSAISAAHASYTAADVDDALVSAERKRRHSAALRGGDKGACGDGGGGGSGVDYSSVSGVGYSDGSGVGYSGGSGVGYSGVDYSYCGEIGSGDASPPPPIGQCRHPHARFLHCYMLQIDRPLTR